MGGLGSGRWGLHDKKTTVEECLTLDVLKLVRDRMIDRTAGGGVLIWSNTRTGEQTAAAGYRREQVGEGMIFRLVYSVNREHGEKNEIDEPILLLTTRSPVGGERWWFTCPLLVN